MAGAGNPGSPPVRKSEDYLLEWKTQNDLRDLLKTMVVFANTVRPGHVATILIDSACGSGGTLRAVKRVAKLNLSFTPEYMLK